MAANNQIYTLSQIDKRKGIKNNWKKEIFARREKEMEKMQTNLLSSHHQYVFPYLHLITIKINLCALYIIFTSTMLVNGCNAKIRINKRTFTQWDLTFFFKELLSKHFHNYLRFYLMNSKNAHWNTFRCFEMGKWWDWERERGLILWQRRSCLMGRSNIFELVYINNTLVALFCLFAFLLVCTARFTVRCVFWCSFLLFVPFFFVSADVLKASAAFLFQQIHWQTKNSQIFRLF